MSKRSNVFLLFYNEIFQTLLRTLEQFFLQTSDRHDILTYSSNSIPDEENQSWLDIGSIFISKNKIVVQRALHQKISTNLFIAAYSRFGEDFFCLVNNNDINRKELALCRPQSDQMEFIDFEALIDKSHLKSDILKGMVFNTYIYYSLNIEIQDLRIVSSHLGGWSLWRICFIRSYLSILATKSSFDVPKSSLRIFWILYKLKLIKSNKIF